MVLPFRLAPRILPRRSEGAWHWRYAVRGTTEERFVHGHMEIRWSHGRFGQPPEAKVYLDSAHEDVPGYHPL